ncbi:MAG: DUF3124 domain-containing protein [Deltaproteobacteria bacterium]|nr:DUF3124 domain-containing protein [Deltaproteobacteria bacterium]
MFDSKTRRAISLICWTTLFLAIGADVGLATDPLAQSKGQTVYAAAYSHVLMGEGQHQSSVTATLIIRNTDLANAIVLTTVDYRDSKGEHLRHDVEKPTVIGPLASLEFVVKDSDKSGGHSPSFIIRWEANTTVNAPVVETLMIGDRGISFIGRAWVIAEAGDPQDEGDRSSPTD